MKILLLTSLVALASGDVSHILNNPVYQYQHPVNSYGAPHASILGNLGASSDSVAYSNAGSISVPQLTLPSVSGPSVQFNSNSGYSGSSSVSGATVQTFENGGFSTPVPISGDALASLQASTAAPNVDYSQFQVSTPSPIGAVDLVHQQQPSSSFQFLSKLSQPTVSSVGINQVQFGSDAALNSGFGQSFASGGQVQDFGGSFGSQYSSGHELVGKTSGGSIDDAFGVSTHAEVEGHLEPEVTKHLYFFAAPEEEEEEAEAKISLPPVAPKKTYKIIFIKAPTYRSQAAITIPAPPQNEEKTLVYVLVKKPEKNAHVRFQAAAPAKPTKPEVFFIKYKTQKEAEAAVAEIQKKHGQVIADLPAGQSLDQFQVQPEVSIGGHGYSGGFDSLGAHSYVSSTPASVSFDSRIGEASVSAQKEPNVSVQSEEVATGVDNAAIGGASSGSVSFQQSGDAGASLGGISDTVNFQQDRLGVEEPQDDGSNKSGTVGAGFVSSAVPTINYNPGENAVASHQDVESSVSTNQEDNSVSNDNEDVSSNLTQEDKHEDVSSADKEGQGSQLTGFQSYGPPNA